MNTLTKVLIGAALVLGLAGLVVGLSLEAQISSSSTNLGAEAAQTHNWTNFASSYVTSKVGFGITASDDSGFTPFVLGTGSNFAPFPANILSQNFTNSANGFTSITTSTTLTPSQFLAVGNQLINNTTGNATETLPAATSTWVAAGSPIYGGWQQQLITNNSTNTLTVVAGTGMTFLCETQGVGTTTSIGGGCTPSLITLNASSVVMTTGFWITSSTFDILWGNMWH